MKKREPKWASFFRRKNFGSASIRVKSQKIYKKTEFFVKRRPLQSFFALLLILLLLISVGKYLSSPKEELDKAKEPISVETYSIGAAPRITVSAQVEKDGVLQIAAQTAGIVSKISVSEGQTVKKGQNLLSLSTNYQGANAATVQRQLAGVQAQSARIAYDANREIISKQKEVAERSDITADDLRNIADKSEDDTRSLISLNESILTSVEEDIRNLESSNAGGVNDALILQTKQLQSQFLSATNQIRSALRTSEVQTNENSAKLSDLQREITLKQLELQEKTLKLQAEAAGLQVRLAQINESLMFPASPFTATIERVHVKIGQQVSPGVPLVTISSNDKSQRVVAYVPQNIAESISKLDTNFLIVDGQKFEIYPSYISQEAVNGQLYAIIYPVTEAIQVSLTDKNFVEMEIPVGYSYTSSSVPYIPIDAVHQTQDKSVVFVIKEGKAEGKTVNIGKLQGNFIEILSGLEKNDVVIVSRNIVSGDPVKVKTQ